MTVSAHISAKSIQNRQILHLVGVPLWAKKVAGQTPIRITTMGDRLIDNSRLAHLAPNTIQAKESADNNAPLNHRSNDAKHKPLANADEQLSQLSKQLHKQSAVHIDEVQSSITTVLPAHHLNDVNQDERLIQDDKTQSDVRFYLQAVRYGCWVLVVNMLTMSHDERTLWQSLMNALSQESQRRAVYGFYREIHYPLIKNEFRLDAGLNPAQYTFDGFLMGVSMPMQSSDVVQVAFLNTMPMGVTLHHAHQLPSIAQMLSDDNLKKVFWKQVVG